MGDEGGQPDSGLLWRHPGAEVPGKERWWYWAPLPSVRHVRETDYRREPAQLALRKGKALQWENCQHLNQVCGLVRTNDGWLETNQ